MIKTKDDLEIKKLNVDILLTIKKLVWFEVGIIFTAIVISLTFAKLFL